MHNKNSHSVDVSSYRVKQGCEPDCAQLEHREAARRYLTKSRVSLLTSVACSFAITHRDTRVSNPFVQRNAIAQDSILRRQKIDVVILTMCESKRRRTFPNLQLEARTPDAKTQEVEKARTSKRVDGLLRLFQKFGSHKIVPFPMLQRLDAPIYVLNRFV